LNSNHHRSRRRLPSEVLSGPQKRFWRRRLTKEGQSALTQNPEGIPHISPGLRRRSYPEYEIQKSAFPLRSGERVGRGGFLRPDDNGRKSCFDVCSQPSITRNHILYGKSRRASNVRIAGIQQFFQLRNGGFSNAADTHRGRHRCLIALHQSLQIGQRWPSLSSKHTKGPDYSILRRNKLPLLKMVAHRGSPQIAGQLVIESAQLCFPPGFLVRKPVKKKRQGICSHAPHCPSKLLGLCRRWRRTRIFLILAKPTTQLLPLILGLPFARPCNGKKNRDQHYCNATNHPFPSHATMLSNTRSDLEFFSFLRCEIFGAALSARTINTCTSDNQLK